MIRIVRSIWLAAVFAAAAFAQFEIRYDPSQRVWTMRNGVIEAAFQLNAEDAFVLQRLSDLRTGDSWASPPGAATSPIRLQVDGTVFDAGARFRLINHVARPTGRRGYRQAVVLEDAGGLGQFRIEWEMYEGQPVLRYRVRFRNLQSDPVRVEAADMAPWTFSDRGQHFRTLRVNQWVQGGMQGNFEVLRDLLRPGDRPVEVLSGAYGQHCGWLALRDEADHGLFLGWEFNGRAAASVQLPRDHSLRLAAEILDLSHPLAPGEEFEVPAGFLGLYHGDWEEASYRTQRFVEAALAQPIPDDSFPRVIWDSWGHQFDINEQVLRREAEIAARLGIELFVIDLGWARTIGDWRADPEKFPSGMRALSDYVHSLGMKFGLHFALAEATEDSPVLEANPDWTSSESYGYFGAVSLCLGHRPVREWLVEAAVRMIEDYNVDWILQDGENMVKVCTKATHTHDPDDSNYANSVQGLDAVIAEIQRRKPNVRWENCEDGGNMMTFKMVQNYVTSITADNTDPLTTRQAVYGALFPFSPRYSDRYMEADSLNTYQTRSYMFGGPWIFMNRLSRMAGESLEFAASEIKIYKALRRQIRDGQVFRLTDRPADDRIDAIESYHPPTDTAVVFVTRPEAADDQTVLRLRGLNPETVYLVRFQEDDRLLSLTGDQLMRGGLTVRLPSMWSAEIVYVEPAASR